MSDSLQDAAAVVLADGLAVFPTETFYGIAARVHPAALSKLAALKGRSSQFPLIAADRTAALDAVTLPDPMAQLANQFWPGPLTVVAQPNQTMPAELCAADGTVAIRVSAEPIATALAREAGGLITSTSANLAGEAPVVRLADLDPQVRAQVGAVLDGGELPGGAPSTIVGCVADRVCVYRAGAIDLDTLEKVLGYRP